MTAATLTLADFLLARIAEDEVRARNAIDRRRTEALAQRSNFGASYIVVGDAFDPARVLAECAAKRAIVEHSAFMLAAWEAKPGGAYPDMNRRERHTANVTLGALASAYADHPDFRDEWRA